MKKLLTTLLTVLLIFPSPVIALEVKKDATPVIYAVMVDSTDGYTAETSVTDPTVYYVKQGGSATSLGSPTWAELDSTNMPGLYSLTLTGAMTDTVGNLIVYVSKAGSRTFRKSIDIVANQEADSYAILNNGTYGNSALESLVDDLEGRLTAARAGYLDKLNVSGTLAHSDTASTYKADVSGLATAAALATAQADLDNPDQYKATGFSTHSAADVWSAATRTLTALDEDDTAIDLDGTNVSLSSAAITGVWDKDISSYVTAGAAGTYLVGAGSAGDPWSTALPGAYGAGTAGYVIGNNLNASVSSRLATAGYTAPDNAGIASILEDTGTTLPSSLTAIQADLDNPNQYKATGFSTHAAADVASLILNTPANKLVTDASGRVTVGSNADKTGYTASTVSDKTGYSLAANQSGVTIGTVTTLTTWDKTGYTLSAAGVDAIWDEVVTGHSTASSYGKLLTDNINATISSRSTLTATDNIGINWADIANPTTTQNLSGTTISSSQGIASVSGAVGSVTGAVTVGTNNDKTGYALSAAGVDAIWNEAQSGHATAGTFGAYLNASVTSVTAPTAAQVADAVWEELIADHSGTTGSVAASLNSIGAAADPWGVDISSGYEGKAGEIMRNIDTNTQLFR